jgi:tripeptidyl-peptidase-1
MKVTLLALFGQAAAVNHPDWDRQSRAAGEAPIELTFALKQQNLEKLEEIFLAVSDPASAQYGQHLTHDEVSELVAPRDSDVQAVMGWLRGQGVQDSAIRASKNSDFIHVVTNVEKAEQLLNGRYHEYKHFGGASSALRMESDPVLPDHVSSILDFVSPTVQQLPRNLPLRNQRKPASLQGGAFTNTPNELRTLYNVGDVEASAPGNKQAVTGFLEQHRTNTDLQEFFRLYYPVASGRKISKDVGDGASEKHVGGQVEAELDTQYIMAMGGNVETEFWTFTGRAPDNPENEPFLKFMTTLSDTPDAEVPLVVSVSYGEDEPSTTLDYANRLNVEFQKAGARGISLLFSSGDNGVAGINGTLFDEDAGCGTDCPAGQGCFVPQWPAGSPYVTAVGGTKQWPGFPEIGEQISSGGFSTRWERPAWQKDAVEKFLQNTEGMPDPSKYRSTGRGFPDIAAQSKNFMVVLDMLPNPVDGTSCSAPTVAGIISLLNDLRLQKGQSPLGFLPPLIYGEWASQINDITGGSNPGCDTNGFPAIAGWDAVTGMGTPNYQQMASVVQGLPSGKTREVHV